MGRRGVLAVIGSVPLVACSSGDDTSAMDASDEPGPCANLGERVGAAADFAVGTWTLVGAVIIAQDADGFFAFTAICTHMGCIIGAPDQKGATVCPCHGSTFDGNGTVTGAPALSSLQHFSVAICEGNVFVNPKKTVPVTTRTPA